MESKGSNQGPYKKEESALYRQVQVQVQVNNNNIKRSIPRQQLPRMMGNGNFNQNQNQTINNNNMYQNNQSYDNSVMRKMNNNNNTAMMRPNNNSINYIPISSINPYNNNWTIIGRCTQKGQLKSFTNSRGSGKVISFDLLGNEGIDIQINSFGMVAEEIDKKVERGKIYMISKGYAVPKNTAFDKTKHGFSIRLSEQSVVEEMPEDEMTSRIPPAIYNFHPIETLMQSSVGDIIDIIGVVESVDPLVTITRKNGEELRKRSLIIKDMSNYSIELTLWGSHAIDIGTEIEEASKEVNAINVVSIKNGRIGDFNGKNISTISGSLVELNPEVAQVNNLKHWAMKSNKVNDVVPLSSRSVASQSSVPVFVADIKKEDFDEKAMKVFEIKAMISGIKEGNLTYVACNEMRNGRICNKKMTEDSNGQLWWCELCQKDTNQPNQKYQALLTIMDHTGIHYVTSFNETEKIFNVSAAQYEAMDDTEKKKVLDNAKWKWYSFKIKAYTDIWQDEIRLKLTVIECCDLDFLVESEKILNEL